MKQDALPFSGQKLSAGAQEWSFTEDTGELTVTANDKDHKVGMVIGVDPLVQYLVAASDGKWQALGHTAFSSMKSQRI